MKWSQAADRRVVEAVVKAFSAPDEGLYARLLPLSVGQWERSYYWLDANGVVLYLLKRLEQLDLLDALPQSVRARFKQNLTDNIERSSAMFREFIELNQAFQGAGIDYCNLKGFTLTPDFCPDPALRTQLDFDFLVDGRDLDRCRKLLVSRGYVLRGVTNTVWEFKTESETLASISDLYSSPRQRSVELHFASTNQATTMATRDGRLDCLCRVESGGLQVPVLSVVDQFLSQATHLFSHLCGPSTRLAWLIEFMNYLNLRFNDQIFWEEVGQRALLDSNAEMGLGVACLAVKQVFDTPLPPALESGCLYRLPLAAKLWTRHYAVRAVLADFPGTKLHLLLREQVQTNSGAWKKAKRRALVPLSRPPRILHVSRDAGLSKRIAGEIYQLRYTLFRCRFHIVQGFAYLRELPRWKRLLKQEDVSFQNEAVLASQTVQSQ